MSKFTNFLGKIAPIAGAVTNVFAPGAGSVVSGALTGIAAAGSAPARTVSPPARTVSPPPSAPPPVSSFTPPAVPTDKGSVSYQKWSNKAVQDALNQGDFEAAEDLARNAGGGSKSVSSSSSDKWSGGQSSSGGGSSGDKWETPSGSFNIAASAAAVVFALTLFSGTASKVVRRVRSRYQTRRRYRRG